MSGLGLNSGKTHKCVLVSGQAMLACALDPVINENDTVATIEIRYGDNDQLAGRVAHLVGADLVILLSDVEGLYTGDPKGNKKVKFISMIEYCHLTRCLKNLILKKIRSL